jgi:hypothetical protein
MRGKKKPRSLHDIKKSRSTKKKQRHRSKTKSVKSYKKRSNCAPDRNENNFTCYNDESLHKIKNAWNKRHPDSHITTNDPKEIWHTIKNNLNDVCNSERCWLNQQFVKSHLDDNLLSYTFAPDSPASWKGNPNEWLTSTDINKVMKQYEKAYPCFAFLGPSPIDFDSKKSHGSCVWEDLCRFNLHNYISKNINKIGMVFNLDPHYKEGSHWIAMFINIRRKYISFFDSNGEKVPKTIMVLVERIMQQGRELGINFEFSQNHPFRHQSGNTECGIYVIYFIINLIKDKHTPHHYKKKKIHDKHMENFRKVFFN